MRSGPSWKSCSAVGNPAMFRPRTSARWNSKGNRRSSLEFANWVGAKSNCSMPMAIRRSNESAPRVHAARKAGRSKMTTLQKAIIGATLAAAIGIGIYETRQPSRLRGQVQTLQQQQALLTEQIARLEEERDDASRSLTTLQQENNRLRQDTPELAKLRAEVARLRTDARDPARWSAAAVEMNDPFTQSVQVMMARAV